jgi:hypothetical protein
VAKTLLGLLVPTIVLMASVAAQPDDADEVGPAIKVIPRVRLGAESEMKLELLFENDSNEVVRYLFESAPHPVRRLHFILLKDGVAQIPVQDRGLMMLEANAVRELPPQKRLAHVLDLREIYGKLEPGEYTLEARVNGQPRDFGLTQLRFRKTVLHVEIVRDNKRD